MLLRQGWGHAIMDKFAIVIAATGALASTAVFAADMRVKVPPAPAPSATSWTGFYLGGGVGFRSAEANPTVTSATGFTTLSAFCSVRPTCMTNEPVNGTAFRFNPYVGVNWQATENWVIGVEGDFGLARKSTALNGMVYPVTGASPGQTLGITGVQGDTFSVETTWDASVRARIGYLVTPRVLLYATGGPSWLHVAAISNCATIGCGPGPLTPSVITDSSTRVGWTVGGGVEAAVWGNWSARAEYRYADYGTVTSTDVRTGPTGLTVTYDLPVKSHTMSLGLAYKLGDPIAPSFPAAPKVMSVKALPATMAAWSGLYIGAAVGLRAMQSDPATTMFFGLPLPGCPGGICFTGEPMNPDAFRLGGYAGYNWQIAQQWITGVEGDLGWGNSRATINGMTYPSFPGLTAVVSDTFTVQATWEASTRARLGYLVTPATLLYGTGGAAFLHVVSTSSSPTGSITGSPSFVADGSTRVGWTIGGGAETLLQGNWFARAEYRYADFGTRTNTDTFIGAQPGTVTYNLPVRTHTAFVGLTYRLGATAWLH
jgi:outer membrane immunogenic protein